MMYGVLTLLPLLYYYQKTTNSAVNRSLASVINNWDDFSKSFYELVKSYTNCCIQYYLLTWVIKVLEYLRTCIIFYLINGLRNTFGIFDWHKSKKGILSYQTT